MPHSSVDLRGGETDSLVARLAEDLNRRWHQGERPGVEEYLARHPELQNQPQAAVELIYEEICLRQELDQQVNPQNLNEEILARFPGWRVQLLALLDCHQALGGNSLAPRFPAVGDSLGDCRLLAEIGRGSQGRVFLALQSQLADRLVVLKVVPLASQEHLSLARLQHTHIVPVYSVHDDLERHLRALCMPYFGGATLDRLLSALQPMPAGQRSGQDLVAVLEHLQATVAVTVPAQGPARALLASFSYVGAVCLLGACLADALHYAHERGLLHLDLKPSNVLLAADGQPMLLDFHLAQPPIRANETVPAWLGGTPGYMAPEHRAALNAVREARPITVAVDSRADVYSLGVLLYETLGGALPVPGEKSGACLRSRNPQVSVGLADLLDRCLAELPQERYPSAAELAADLRRHLDDQPLRGVANRSWSERWRKWRRRQPHSLLLLSVLLPTLVVVGLLLEYCRRQVAGAQLALKEGRSELHRQQYQEAVSSLKRGRDLIDAIPFPLDVRQQIHDELRQAEAVQELHQFAEQIRALGGADVVPAAQMRLVEVQCRKFWDHRQMICKQLRPEPDEPPGLSRREDRRDKPGGSSRQRQLQADLLDVAVLWTGLRVRQARDKAAARREAMQVLDQAEELFGQSAVLWQERLTHAEALGQPAIAQESRRQVSLHAPRTAWEHLALGRALLQANQPEALDHLERSLKLQPGSLWANFYRGKCRYQLGDYQEALCSFSVCVALAPDRAWCFCNRGLAHQALEHLEQAVLDQNRALELEPTLGEAAFYRGQVRFQQGRYDFALADFLSALERGVSPAAVACEQARVHLTQGNPKAARDALKRAVEADPLNISPEHKEARSLLDRLSRDP